MKKIILGAVVAAAIFGGFTANQTSSEVAMSDLQVENLEVLAQTPEVSAGPICHEVSSDVCYKDPDNGYEMKGVRMK